MNPIIRLFALISLLGIFLNLQGQGFLARQSAQDGEPAATVPFASDQALMELMGTWNPAPWTSYSAVWGDVDNDGDLDLAVGNYFAPNQLYLNEEGNLTLSTWSPNSDSTFSVAWGDADNDGDLDLAVGNFGQPNQLYLNVDGRLQNTPAWTAAGSANTTCVAWGDVNGDGYLDLAVGNNLSSNQLYLNDGHGNLTPSSWAPISNHTFSIAWGDVDGDGDLDLAVGNYNAPPQLYLNVGGMLQDSAILISTNNNYTYSLAWGDVDNDGDLDLALGNNFSQNQLYINENGTLQLSAWAPAFNDTVGLAWGDVDSDGDLDLAVGNYSQPIEVYLNVNGVLQNTPAWSADAGYSTWSVAWGDIDGDSDLDLAVANRSFRNQIYLNKTFGMLLSGWSPAAQDTDSLAWGDVDGDGDLDLAVGNNQDQANQLYLNDGHGNLTLSAWAPAPNDTRSIAWGDVNGDGLLDLAVGNEGLPNQLYLNQNGMLQNTPVWTAGGHSYNTNSIAWADVDGDGDLDLAVGNNGQPNQLYLSQDGVLQDTPAWTAGTSYNTRSIAWGDVDGDGDLDLMVGNEGQPNQLYLNQNGVLQLGDWAPAAAGTTQLAWGDVDGDGDLDLAVAAWLAPVQLYLNTGGRLQNTPYWTAPSFSSTESLAWGDVDGDGDLDLAVGNVLTPNQVYLNEQGVLQLSAWALAPAFTWSMAWGDADGDGTLDLAVGNSSQNTSPPPLTYNQLYLNQRPANPLDPRQGAEQLSLDLANSPANGYATPHIWDQGAIPFTYTLTIPSGVSQTLSAEYSLNGGGQWFPAVAVSGTLTQNLTTTLGRALQLDGVDDYVTIANESNFDLNVLSIAAWFRVDTFTIQWQSLVTKGDNAWRLHRNSSTNTLGFATNGLSNLDLAGTVDVNDGKWHHVAAVWDGSTKYLYIDGTLDVSAAATGSLSQNNYQVYLGENQQFTGRQFDGNLDEVRIYNRALTAAEVALLAKGGALESTGLAGYWPLDEGTGTVAADQTPNHNDGTLVNGPRWVQGVPRVTRLFQWDVLASSLFGQSDNVIFRLTAWPIPLPKANRIPGPYQRGSISAATFPMRVRGSQVRVMQSGSPNDLSAPGAQVYRLRPGEPSGSPLADLAGQPYRTNAQGYLAGYSEVVPGDRLAALWPAPVQPGTDLNFDGENDYIDRAINISETSYGLALWFKTTCTHCGIFSVVANGGADHDRHIYLNGGNLCARVFAEETICTTGTSYADGQWHHVVHTFGSGEGQKIYVDGSLAASGVKTSSDFTWQTGVNLGISKDAANHYFNGLLREVRLYNRLLTAADVALLANGGDPAPTGLVIDWPMDEGEGSLVHDRTMNGNDGTIYGAAWQVPPYKLYYTSAAPNTTGLDILPVGALGVQTLTVTSTNPLALFNLTVSLEWDARYDTTYTQTLQYNFERASELLYDWTNGQAALGEVTIYHDRQYWDEADIRIYATNRLRPNAAQGGITPFLVTDPFTSTITYAPGMVRMGATWNRYGEPGGALGDDWPRTLAHELSHYLLYLDDNYLGLTPAGQIIPVSDCSGAMSDPYRQDTGYDEFHRDALWLAECSQTLSNVATGRSDWSTIRTFYPELASYEDSGNPGPTTLLLEVTQVSFVAPSYAPTALADPTFYLTEPSGGRYLPGKSARAFLFQTVGGIDRLVDLGSPVLDHVLARGARPDLNDRLCVFEAAANRLGCEPITANDTQLVLEANPAWQPEITITPISSRTISLTVEVPEAIPGMLARLFPAAGLPTDPIPLAASGSTFSGVFITTDPALAGYVQIWVPDSLPHLEAVTDYALGGNPGYRMGSSGTFQRSRLAPAMSADGQVILYGQLNFPEGEFYALQEVNRIPTPLPWATPIGPAYRLTASAHAPSLDKASLSISYLPGDVPSGEEEWIRMYFWDGTIWQILPSTLDTYQNAASGPAQGTGVYALMSSYPIRLYPGWNIFAYPVSGSRPVTQTLESIAGNYGSVYFYDPLDTLDHWKLYDPGVPPYVIDLYNLTFGSGYWISVTQNITTTGGITLYIRGANGSELSKAGSFDPPATFYGALTGNDDWTPLPGQEMTAWVDGVLCGTGQTRQVAEQVVYTVNVFSDSQTTGCGAPGKAVSFRVGKVWFPLRGDWNRTHPIRLDLGAGVEQRVFLPFIEIRK